MSDHEELESSVAAWVLGALDAGEAEAIRVHVEGCASCQEAAGRLRRVVGALPLAVEEATPPPRLRERILTAAATSTRTSQPPVAAPVRRAPKVASRPSLVARAGQRIPLYAVAAVAVLALLAGALVGESVRGTQPPPVSSQVTRFTLAGHAGMTGAQATVIDLRSDGLALVDFRGLPSIAAGRVYEVWLIRSGASPEPAAVFVPDSNGSKVVLVNRSLAGYTVMAVTDEPGPDGSPAPTEQPQLYGNVA
jgi:anti-sigma-K factor RskA